MENCSSIQFVLLAFYASCNTDMTDGSTQVFNEIVPTQESNERFKQLEDMSAALAIVSDCSSQTCDDDHFFNESVTVENVITPERNYTAYDHFEYMPSALVIVSDSSSQTCCEDQLVSESVTTENVSINLE